MKKLLSFLLVMVVSVKAIIMLVPPVKASAAHSVVMTADEFIGYLQYVVDRGDSRYGSGGEKSIGKYDGKYIYFDCWGLGESIICTKGQIVYNKSTSLNPWNLWDTSCGCGSKTGDCLKSQSELSTDFTNILPGEWLFKDNANGNCYHVGYYIGNGKVIESTTDGSYNTQVTTIDSSGRSNIRGSSWKWTSHGKVPWISYHTCSNFSGLGVCTDCGKTYDWQSTFNSADAGTYKVAMDFTPRTDAPYSDATKGDAKIKKGSTVKVDGSYINAYNNKWIKFTYNGESGYVLADGYLELSSYNNLKVDCAGFTPTENESLTLGQGYPVWGTVSSNYPLKKVVAKLDGKEYATWTATNDNTTSFAINPTDINQQLKFGSLAAGKHTVTMIATDIHGRTQTFLTRSFNMVSTSCSHSYGSSYKTDENNHWKVCSKCGSSASVGTHNYTNNCDASCNTCGAIRTVNHSYENYSDEGYHWRECSSCGLHTTPEAHDWIVTPFDEHHTFICSGCYTSRILEHVYYDDCDTTCDICHYTRTITHTYSNSCDSSCNTCGATRTTSHVYDNACDTSCNVCGATRSTSHEYDNACDPSCNVCGATRTVNHKYSNACDKNCDICGAVRQVSGHVFDHDCDTSCNNCGYSRATDHTYDSKCDTSCNVCGATRTVSHTYTSKYSSNTTSHWRTCTSCGHKGYVENHIPGSPATESTPQKCLACEFIIQEAIGHTHKFGTEYEKDSQQHWYQCDDKNCGAKANIGNHVYSNGCDESCNTCGYTRAVNHSFDNGKITKEPSATEKGEILFTCTECGEEKREEIDTLPGDPETPDYPETPDDPETPENPEGSGDKEKSNNDIITTIVIVAVSASSAITSVAVVTVVLVLKKTPARIKSTNNSSEESAFDDQNKKEE